RGCADCGRSYSAEPRIRYLRVPDLEFRSLFSNNSSIRSGIERRVVSFDGPVTQHTGASDPQALAQLIATMYEELRTLARHSLRWERAGHTLNTTALVHEVYLRLRAQHHLNWENRAHFFSTAATLMRRILTDYARSRTAAKRMAPQPARALA